MIRKQYELVLLSRYPVRGGKSLLGYVIARDTHAEETLLEKTLATKPLDLVFASVKEGIDRWFDSRRISQSILIIVEFEEKDGQAHVTNVYRINNTLTDGMIRWALWRLGDSDESDSNGGLATNPVVAMEGQR